MFLDSWTVFAYLFYTTLLMGVRRYPATPARDYLVFLIAFNFSFILFWQIITDLFRLHHG